MTRALYYPTIEFQDLDALKRSLLVWDDISRIVPQGYAPLDESEVRVAVSSGVIENLLVDENEKADAARSFLDFYSLRHTHTNRLVWPAGFSTQTFTLINPDKIDAKLVPLFEQLSQRLTNDGFLEVPRELAGGYMFYLAASVASNRGMDLSTDSSDYWAVGSYFAADGNFTETVYAEATDAYLSNLAIDDLLPDSLEGVPIDKVLRFRDDYADLRHEFQRELRELRAQIARCNSKAHARYIVGDFIKRFQRAKDEYRKSLKFFRKTDVCSLISVGIPTAASILSLPVVGGGSDPYAPVRLGTGLLIGAVSALAARQLISKQRTVASYLVDAERLTRTPSWLLHRKFEEFIND